MSQTNLSEWGLQVACRRREFTASSMGMEGIFQLMQNENRKLSWSGENKCFWSCGAIHYISDWVGVHKWGTERQVNLKWLTDLKWNGMNVNCNTVDFLWDIIFKAWNGCGRIRAAKNARKFSVWPAQVIAEIFARFIDFKPTFWSSIFWKTATSRWSSRFDGVKDVYLVQTIDNLAYSP